MQSALIISEKMQLMCQEMDKGCFFLHMFKTFIMHGLVLSDKIFYGLFKIFRVVYFNVYRPIE